MIVDLDKAPLNARGKVEYETDFFILRPADPAKGSGVMLYEVINRGNKFLLDSARRGAGEQAAGAINDPRTRRMPGHRASRSGAATPSCGRAGIRMRRRADNGMSDRLPVRMEDGKPIVRRIREEIQVGTRGPADVAVVRLRLSGGLDRQDQWRA